MAKKQFKAESKRLLDLMINSIYTHKEIFLRELISNASDAIDKLYYKSLTEKTSGVSRDGFAIRIAVDKDARTLTISDNGIGMTKEEMEQNLGTIARSGSLAFAQGSGDAADVKKGEAKKKAEQAATEIDIIGQFGVGFYSSFMVSSDVRVVSRAYGSDDAWEWASSGADGYSVKPTARDEAGTDVILTIKEDTADEKYGEYLDDWRVRNLIKRYSDYIRYPIKMNVERERAGEGAEGEDVQLEKYYEERR
jgi:molecular chaperone HtpG